MIKPIVLSPDKRLLEISKPVEYFDDSLKQLGQDLLDTIAHHNAFGLAAPQIGSNQRVIVITTTFYPKPEESPYLLIVNPTWDVYGTAKAYPFEEGCLSIPGFFVKTNRTFRISWQGYDINHKRISGLATGPFSVCFQHEVDHLDGKLMIPR
jgi:peptide deformylase